MIGCLIDSTMFVEYKGKIWLSLYAIFFLFILFFELLFFMLGPLHEEFNDFLADLTGASINYVMILMLIVAIPLIYSIYLLIFYGIKFGKTKEARPHLANRIIPPILLIVYIGLFYILIWQFGEEAFLIPRILGHYSVYLYLFLILGFIVFLYPLSSEIVKFWRRTTSKSDRPIFDKSLFLSIIAIVSIFIFVVPMIFQPVYALSGALPAKPEIIAHRGGQHYTPENTIIAGVYTSQVGAAGWEIDVQLSVDGVPFLMHDSTLERTTDADEVFPGRENYTAAYFTIAELQSLNAGEWFVDTDPYGTIAEGTVPTDLLDDYEIAAVPTLEEILDFTNDTNLILCIEVKSIPDNHPYYDQYFDIVLDVLIEADMDDQICVLSGNEDRLDLVESLAPDMITALELSRENPPTAAEFLAKGYDMINTHYSLSNKILLSYAEAGIISNIYTVDLTLSFQQAWVLGVNYVTTNEPLAFIEMEKPTWYMSKGLYVGIWLIIEFVGIAIVFVVKYVYQKKTSSES